MSTVLCPLAVGVGATVAFAVSSTDVLGRYANSTSSLPTNGKNRVSPLEKRDVIAEKVWPLTATALKDNKW